MINIMVRITVMIRGNCNDDNYNGKDDGDDDTC